MKSGVVMRRAKRGEVGCTSHSGSATSVRIRSAALQLFVQYGFQAVGLRQIAECIGIQAGSLYNHIEGKTELLFQLVYELEHSLVAVLNEAVEAGESPQQRLELYVGAYVRYASLNKDLHTLSSREAGLLEGWLGDRIAELKRNQCSLLCGIVEDGVDRGAFSAGQADLVTLAIMSMTAGLVTRVEGGPELERRVAVAQSLALRMLCR